MEIIYQLRIQHGDEKPITVNTKIGEEGLSDLKEEKKELRLKYPDAFKTKIWTTPVPAERKEHEA